VNAPVLLDEVPVNAPGVFFRPDGFLVPGEDLSPGVVLFLARVLVADDGGKDPGDEGLLPDDGGFAAVFDPEDAALAPGNGVVDPEDVLAVPDEVTPADAESMF